LQDENKILNDFWRKGDKEAISQGARGGGKGSKHQFQWDRIEGPLRLMDEVSQNLADTGQGRWLRSIGNLRILRTNQRGPQKRV